MRAYMEDQILSCALFNLLGTILGPKTEPQAIKL